MNRLTTFVLDPAREEVRDVAREQERARLRRRWEDRGCGRPCVCPGGRDRLPRRTDADDARGGGRRDQRGGRNRRDRRGRRTRRASRRGARKQRGGRAGSIDVSFNAISLGDVQGTPLLEMPLEDYSRPIMVGTTTHLLTARAAARHSSEERARSSRSRPRESGLPTR